MEGAIIPKPPSVVKVTGHGKQIVFTVPGSNGSSTVISALTVSSNFYALNVFLNTFLFVLVFMSGTACTTAVLEYVKEAPTARKMVWFAAIITVFTCTVAIGFGELSRLNKNIQVDYQQDLG
jgi:hypothetical protein